MSKRRPVGQYDIRKQRDSRTSKAPGTAGRRHKPWYARAVLEAMEPRLLLTGLAANAALYDRWLVTDASDTSPALQAAVTTLDTNLEDMTGLEFTQVTRTSTGHGIFILRKDAGEDLASKYPALVSQQSDLNTLGTKSSEAFFIYSTGANNLFIVGNSDAAVSLGVYYYLNRLGWRSLLPNDNWLIKPQLSSITLTVDSVQEPAFRQRTFSGTGGLPTVPLDPTGQCLADWTLWQKENFFGGITVGGHQGEAFVNRNKAALDADAYANGGANGYSHLMACVDGQWQYKYRCWDPSSPNYNPAWQQIKPNTANTAFQQLWLADMLNQYSLNPNAFALSVEPSDGYGFDNQASTLAAFPTDSDQAFYLAMLTANYLRANGYPNARVSLFAYNTHAAVPTRSDVRAWLANPQGSVYVDVIPYAFQTTGKSGDVLAAEWAAAMPSDRGIYDYWSMPDWGHNLPDQNFILSIQKLQSWDSMNYDGFVSESTYSGGAVGLLWYMAGQLMWNPNQDPVALRQDFYTKAFGAAAPVMQRMMERWGSNFSLTDQEVGLAFQDIAMARTLVASDPACLARVNDYGKYVQYIRLYFEYDRAVARYAIGSTQRHTAADNLMKFMWQIYGTDMVSTYRMSQLIRNSYEGGGDPTLQADWDVSNPNAAGWNWVRANPFTDANLASCITSGLATYTNGTPPTTHAVYPQPAYSSTLTALDPNYTLDGQRTAETNDLYASGNFAFYVKPGISSVTFEFKPGILVAGQDIVSIYNPSGTLVYTNSWGGSGQDGVWQTFTVPTSTSGNYTITVQDPKKSYRIRAERNLPFVMTSPLTCSYQVGQKAYFYVPPGVSTVGLYAPGALAIIVRDSNGTVVNRSFGDGIDESDYAVPSGQDNKIWSMEGFKCYAPGAWELNLPRVWSFSPDGSQHGMMVPVNAAPTVNAGNDATTVAPTNTVSLDGTVTDDHRTASPYVNTLWTKISGPGTVTFGSATAVDTTATFQSGVYGTYVLRLTATDTGSLAAYDEVTVNYVSTAPNTAPVVNAGNDATVTMVGATATATLDATVSDDGKPTPPGALTYSWTKLRGPDGSMAWFANPAAVDTTAYFDTPGTYMLRLAVSDSQLSRYDEVTVTVNPDWTATTYQIGDTGAFGAPNFNYASTGQTFADADSRSGYAAPSMAQYSARFRAMENINMDRVYQRFLGVDAGTYIQVGIMADNGSGKPTGIYLASTAAFHPTEGVSWSPQFSSSVALTAGQIYHVVTKVTAMGDGDSFYVNRSSSTEQIRPYDRATDLMMSALTSADGGATWTVSAYDPYFTLGYGATPTVVPGPGNAQQVSNTTISSRGGATGTVMGQKFTISTREASADSRVALTGLTMSLYRVGATHDLIVKLRDGDGAVLGTITVPYASITTSELYYFTTVFSDANTKANNWGGGTGTSPCVPIQATSGAGWANCNWSNPTVFAGFDAHDLFFSLAGSSVTYATPHYPPGTGIFGNSESFSRTAATTLSTVNTVYDARFQPHETVTIDRAWQLFVGMDAGTRIEVGIMADDGSGKPDGRFLASTGSYDPVDGTYAGFSPAFTAPVTLNAAQVYHLVTRITALGGGESFAFDRSYSTESIRPFDRAYEPYMNVLTSTDNGATWTVTDYDPYFALANGATLIQGPGQAVTSSATSQVLTRGGATGLALGQKFTITMGEVPLNSQVTLSALTMSLLRASATTHDLILKLRDSAGSVLGTITVPYASVTTTNTQYTWSFDSGTHVTLTQGQTYFLTSEIAAGSTTSETYSFLSTYTEGPVSDTSWGGTTTCFPIQSAASNSWTGYTWASPTLYAGRQNADIWFSFQGLVSRGSPQYLAADAPLNPDAAVVDSDQLAIFSREAIRRWSQTGVDASSLALLVATPLTIADLPDREIGLSKGSEILIDLNAGGAGWYIDPRPRTDSEFKDLKRPKGVDLLTVLMHEYGHRLGMADVHGDAALLMDDELSTGVRRNPIRDITAAVPASAGNPFSTTSRMIGLNHSVDASVLTGVGEGWTAFRQISSQPAHVREALGRNDESHGFSWRGVAMADDEADLLVREELDDLAWIRMLDMRP